MFSDAWLVFEWMFAARVSYLLQLLKDLVLDRWMCQDPKKGEVILEAQLEELFPCMGMLY